MKKSFIVLLVILFPVTCCYSQDKACLSLQFGSSIPTGDFGNTNASKSKAGLAKNGSIFEVSFTGKFNEYLGLTGIVIGGNNSMDKDALLNYYHSQYPDIDWSVNTTSWVTGGLFFGGYGSVPLWKDKLSLDFKLTLGFLHCKSPELTSTGAQGTHSLWVNMSSASGNSFSTLIGTGLKYNISKSICFLANLEYVSAAFDFQNIQLSSNFGYSNSGYLTQDFSEMNLVAGIGIRM